MFGIILAVAIMVFGIFLKTTNDPKFAGSKKFSWMFIILGIFKCGREINYYVSKRRIIK